MHLFLENEYRWGLNYLVLGEKMRQFKSIVFGLFGYRIGNYGVCCCVNISYRLILSFP